MKVDPRLIAIDDCLYRVAVKAIIMREDKILLVKEDTDEFWSIPGGGLDYGESPLEALQRELLEETGIEASKIKINERIECVLTGLDLKGVPKINLIYKAELTDDNINIDDYRQTSGWFSKLQIADMYISPSTGGASELMKIWNAVLHNIED